MQVERYDFFLLISATRFTKNDTWLGNEITKMHRKYFFVRTKVGADIYSNTKAYPRTHNEETVLSTIRKNAEKHLKEYGCESTPVFLVDSYMPMKFSFKELEQKLINDFPELKKSAMILSMCAFSEEMIRLKASELRSRIWKVATASAVVAAVPAPGVSAIFDTAVVLYEVNFYFKQLALDDDSLRRHAALTKTDYNKLKSIVDQESLATFLTAEGLTEVARHLPKTAATCASMAIEEVSRYIPFFGSAIAAPLSFATTYYMLKFVLDKLEKVAMEVVTYAAENDRSLDDEGEDGDNQ